VPWENAIADKIGRGKCWTCTYPDSCKDLNDVLVKHGPEAVRECIDNAKPVPVSGLTTFAEHAGEIREYFQDGGLSRGLSTGWKNLDELLRLRPGTVNVVTGIPSSGKSEWLDQLMLNAIRLHGWRWCMFSPENLPLPYHCQKLAEKLLCKPMFPRYSLPAMTTTDVEKAIRTLSASITFITLDERGLDLDGILSRARVCAVRDGIRGMILDPYNEIEHRRPAGMNESEYVSAFLSKVRTFARLYDVAVFVVAHPTKLQKMDSGEHKGDYPVPTPYDISGSANWRNKADVCIAAWRSYQADENTVQIHVQKVRDKNLGQTGMVELHWHRATGLFFVTEEDLREAVQASHAADERPAGCDDGEWC